MLRLLPFMMLFLPLITGSAMAESECPEAKNEATSRYYRCIANPAEFFLRPIARTWSDVRNGSKRDFAARTENRAADFMAVRTRSVPRSRLLARRSLMPGAPKPAPRKLLSTSATSNR